MIRAILRKPGKSFINAIAQDPNHQQPDYHKTIEEYKKYAETLEKMGLEVNICEPDEKFADGNFVEDSFLILDEIIIELNPGAATRSQEPQSLASFLMPFLPPTMERKALSKTHTMDGGDILQDRKNLYVGLSTRTEQSAIDELTNIVAPFAYQVLPITVPEGLHLKSGMTLILPNHFVIQASFEKILQNMQLNNPDIKYFTVPTEEYFAANVLPINGKIMIPAGCPITKSYILQYYKLEDIYEVDTQQVRRVDGALTCSSLLLNT